MEAVPLADVVPVRRFVFTGSLRRLRVFGIDFGLFALVFVFVFGQWFGITSSSSPGALS